MESLDKILSVGGIFYSFAGADEVFLWVVAVVLCSMFAVYAMRRDGIITVSTYPIYLVFFSNIVMLPFNRSPLNILSLGADAYARYPLYLGKAFILSVLGVVVLIAGYIYFSNKGRGLPGFFIVTNSVKNFWLRQDVVLVLASLSMFLASVMAVLGVPFFKGRNFAMRYPELRPLIMLHANLSSLAIMLSLMRLFISRSTVNWMTFSLALVSTMSIGTRGALLSPVLMLIATIYTWGRYCRPRHALFLIAVVPVFVVLISAIGELRSKQTEKAVPVATTSTTAAAGVALSFLYGNDFSDLRDFSWILSGWDGEFFYGKTELSGMASFIPSAFLPARREWALGPKTLEMVGLGFFKDVHPGLRPTFVGEAYLNFGFVGLVVMALAYGAVLGRISTELRAARRGEKSNFVAIATTSYIYMDMFSGFLISAGFFDFYINAVLVVFGTLCVAVSRRDGSQPKANMAGG